MFRTSLTVAGILILGAASAPAADMRMPLKGPPPVVAAYNWTGFYIGGGIGYTWAHVDDFTVLAGVPVANNPKGAVFGVQAGYDFQINNVVFGLELAAPFASTVKGSVTDPSNAAVSYSGKLQYAVLGTAHVGYAIGSFLPYIGGGAVVASGKATVNGFLPGTGLTPGQSVSDTQTHFGATFLAGLRYGFAPNWWGAVQYNYTAVGAENYTLGTANRAVGINAHSVQGMLSYKF